MDELFQAAFSTFEEVDLDNKIRPLCGRCRRYMKYINIRSVSFRLHVLLLDLHSWIN